MLFKVFDAKTEDMCAYDSLTSQKDNGKVFSVRLVTISNKNRYFHFYLGYQTIGMAFDDFYTGFLQISGNFFNRAKDKSFLTLMLDNPTNS